MPGATLTDRALVQEDQVLLKTDFTKTVVARGGGGVNDVFLADKAPYLQNGVGLGRRHVLHHLFAVVEIHVATAPHSQIVIDQSMTYIYRHRRC